MGSGSSTEDSPKRTVEHRRVRRGPKSKSPHSSADEDVDKTKDEDGDKNGNEDKNGDDDNDEKDEDSMVKLCQDFKNLLVSGEGSDIIIQVADKHFRLHRLVLMARSSVFASMFRHNMKENATGVVNIGDCDPTSFPLLLEFMYCATTEKLSVENVFSLYRSADKYDVQDLKRKCLKFIKSNLSVDTFCETVGLCLQHSENDLLQFTLDFFAKNFKEIILTVKWQTFIVENPIQSNEIFIKALASEGHKE